MKYQVFVSGAPRSRSGHDAAPDGQAYPTDSPRSGGDGSARQGFSGDGSSARQGFRGDGAGFGCNGSSRPGYRADSTGFSGDGATHQDFSGNGGGFGGDGAPYSRHRGTPVLRRFPPVIQFLTDVDPYVQHQLQKTCVKAHRQGRSLQEICQELYVYARSVGYVLMLGVQEVFSTQMPSFPQQTVQSALLLADLNRITAPNGYHEGRIAV